MEITVPKSLEALVRRKVDDGRGGGGGGGGEVRVRSRGPDRRVLCRPVKFDIVGGVGEAGTVALGRGVQVRSLPEGRGWWPMMEEEGGGGGAVVGGVSFEERCFGARRTASADGGTRTSRRIWTNHETPAHPVRAVP